jgi:predicted nucleic acid-binding protein
VVTRAFVDTSALLALLDRADARHDAVARAFRDLAGADLVTSGYVVAESLAVARRRFGVDGAIALIDDLLPAISALPIDPERHDHALAGYRASLPSAVSFVDRVSLAVIEREEIEVVLAIDPDLTAAGVPVLPAD